MTLFSRRAAARLIAAAGFALALSAPCLAQSLDRQDGMGRDTQQLVQRLRMGGYVIVVRHGATVSNQADTDPFNFDDVTKQRNLNDKGKELAKAFGDAVRRVGLPVGDVYTSKFNRAYETAVLAGFENIERTVDLTEGGLVVTPDENNRRAEAFRKMLAQAPAQGKNNFLITHKPNIVDALGVWSRSVGESAKLIPHSGRDYGPGTSRLRHDHARRPNCDTAIEGSAQGTSGAVPQDSCQVA